MARQRGRDRGDVDRLDFQERTTLRLYHALSGEKLPYAMLIYAWSSAAPVGTTAPSVHTDKIQTIVVDRGSLGEWREFRRNVFEDYDLPGLKTVGHVCVLGAEKAAWFKDTEGNFLCIHEDIE